MRGLYKIVLITLVGIVLIVASYFALGYFSTWIGWEGYKKWEHRVATNDIGDSKRRGVFVKELNFKIENYHDTLRNFKPYIERGFKFGRHSSDSTTPLTGSAYPYQLSFNFKTSSKVGLLMMPAELKKFDSSDAVWGYLTHPDLKDTIIVSLVGQYGDSGIVKVWQ
jgi:hypothetical protein